MPKNIWRLVASIVICQSAGIIGAVFTVSAIKDWYLFLNKPSFSPPNWLFGPVWTTLYFLMGTSLYWIWVKKQRGNTLKIFALHLALNTSWSLVFFGLHTIFLALMNIMVLWILILMVMIKFYKIDKKAGLILIPYLLWVSFATILNYNIWLLNK